MKPKQPRRLTYIFTKPILLGLFSLLNLVLAGIICFYLGEWLFFDKLFYKKSVFHGYASPHFDDNNLRQTPWLSDKITAKRESDLRKLLNQPNFEIDKNSKVKNIAIIGDSIAYGLGVLPREMFSDLLASELSRFKISAKVYNFSEPGNSIVDYVALYQLVKEKLNFDLIVVTMVANDLLLNEPNRYPNSELILEKLDELCIKPLYENFDINYSNSNEFLHAANLSFSPYWRNRCYLTQIAGVLGRDPSVVFFSFNVSENLPRCSQKNDNLEKIILADYSSLIQNLGGEIFQYELNSMSEKDRVSVKESHPSRYLHQKYAQELAKFLAIKFNTD